MLRLIHNQTVSGAILVDDIDDGLPNKPVHRLGSTADPKAYVRDGYANKPKQPCYIPRVKATNPAIPGYIDLEQTDRVMLSAGRGKISKLSTAVPPNAPLISVVSFVASDLATPAITTPGGADLGTPGVGDLTISGTKFLSLTPNESIVTITGTGAVTLTQAQIIDPIVGGTFTDTAIFVPAILIPGVVITNSFAMVTADDNDSNVVALS
jgi:hypothetical protein